MIIKPKKKLGQNFLINKTILSKIVKLGEVKNNDTILEIGPGTGNLTEEILKKKPFKLIVVEKDINLSNILKKKFGDKIIIINNDILKCLNNFKFEKPIKVFGNLPYNISTKILVSLIKINELNKLFSQFIFVFQKEVAERIIAEENSKNYGRLAILTYWKMMTKKIIDIPPNFFYPKPKVWSSLVYLRPKKNIENLRRSKNLEHVTNIFFNQRRKMIKKPMKQLFVNYENTAKQLDIDLNLRPQNLSKSKYFEICRMYENLR